MKKIKVFVILFVIAGGIYSLYLVVFSLYKNDKPGHAIHIDRLTAPKYITPQETIESPVVGKTDYLRMLAFKKYMDSLKANNKRNYDSIMVFRPGLMDSISFLEKIYLSQNKN